MSDNESVHGEFFPNDDTSPSFSYIPRNQSGIFSQTFTTVSDLDDSVEELQEQQTLTNAKIDMLQKTVDSQQQEIQRLRGQFKKLYQIVSTRLSVKMGYEE